MSNGKNILVIKLGAFGDFILSLGAFEALREKHKGDKLVLMTIPSLKGLAEKSGLFDEIIEDDRARSIAHYLRIRSVLKNGDWDMVYDLQTQNRTNRYYKLLWPGKKPNWCGTAKGCSHPDPTPNRSDLHSAERYKRQLESVGVGPVELAKADWIDADVSHLNLPEKFVLIASGCAPHRPEKRWPPELYAGLCRELLKQGMTPVLLGTAAEADVTKQIADQAEGVLDLTNKTNLFEIGGLARKAIGAVGNDTGPMHLIATAGCPSLVLYSNASCPKKTHPCGPQVECLQKDDLADLPVADVMANLQLR